MKTPPEQPLDDNALQTAEENEYTNALKAVQGGDVSAKTKLAWLILAGRGGSDVRSAVQMLEERVMARDTEAMWMLGICNEFGIGTERNTERAHMLYCQSYDGENEAGRILMDTGRNHERGNGYLQISCLLILH